MMTKPFENPNNWDGGFYELSFELINNKHSTIRKSLESLWTTPFLQGCYAIKDIAPDSQDRIPFSALPTEGHLFGLAKFPDEKLCECGTYTSDFQESGQWISLYLPMGALSNLFSVGGFPFVGNYSPHPRSWITPLNGWLKNIAETIYPNVNFKIAVIGFEAEFTTIREEVFSGKIADKRWDGILLPQSDKLIWYPPTIIDFQYSS